MYKNSSVSIKSIYFWNLMGSICNAALSVVLLLLVTRTATTAYADMFSIGFALAQQFSTIGIFQVRNYQATDVKEKFSFSEYFSFRLLTSGIMVAYSVIYILVKGYGFEKSSIVFLLCLTKMIEALSDVYQGFFQQKERLDIAGKTLALRAALSCVTFGICMVLSHNIYAAIICMILASVGCYVIYEKKSFRKVSGAMKLRYEKKYVHSWYSLFRQCLPLFINGYLIMAIYNAPKNAIDSLSIHDAGTLGMQTDYNILFMPASVINLFLIFLRPFMTHMAYAWTQKQRSIFQKLMQQIVGGIVIFSAVTVLGAYILGIPVLSILYGRDLSAYRIELVILIIAGGFSSLATVFDNIITVIRKQHLLVISYVLSWGSAILFSGFFVKLHAIAGAAVSFLISMVILALANAVILWIGLRQKGA